MTNHQSEGFDVEVDALDTMFNHLDIQGYTRITIIAKSLGAVVTSLWLESFGDDVLPVDIAILGFVPGDDMRTAIFGNMLKICHPG